ncbi:hypothetical protein TSOC_010027 [Tetrabaena socialis]|uniref:FAM194 C-terminal domain-containing protein n=1 Tax=Tetrabaena socialis TaxID=47790 RepID=A0A2J7ZUC3_9CHLO|nr:hypothetical protein TSOC_010027 [Tetrabaena socialis]|eukprot:PNH03871.1 hypothetical protein TSOC_010027 [Tetrabaena socialis]
MMANGPNDHGPSTSGRSDLDKTTAQGDGMVYYPSGNLAVAIIKQPAGHIITFFSDARASQVLASFDAQGVYKVDASEGNTLQDRYGFRTVPMFLMFYEGRLVLASNNVRTESELREAALGALVRGRKRDFLPEGFRFSTGADNTMLDYIRPHTVLREL